MPSGREKKQQQSKKRKKDVEVHEVPISPKVTKTKPTLDLCQSVIMRVMNIYLAFSSAMRSPINGDPVLVRKEKQPIFIEESGYCNGLGLAWIGKMAHWAEEEYYDAKYDIASCPVKHDHKTPLEENIKKISDSLEDPLVRTAFYQWMDDIEVTIEKFLAQMEWGQNSEKYTEADPITQQDIDRLLETDKKLKSFRGDYTARKLRIFLSGISEEGEVVGISGGPMQVKVKTNPDVFETKCHFITIFYRDDCYHLYDSNFSSGKALKTILVGELEQEIRKSLYTYFDREPPEVLPLRMNVINFPHCRLVDSAEVQSPSTTDVVVDLPKPPSASPGSNAFTMFGVWRVVSKAQEMFGFSRKMDGNEEEKVPLLSLRIEK